MEMPPLSISSSERRKREYNLVVFSSTEFCRHSECIFEILTSMNSNRDQLADEWMQYLPFKHLQGIPHFHLFWKECSLKNQRIMKVSFLLVLFTSTWWYLLWHQSRAKSTWELSILRAPQPALLSLFEASHKGGGYDKTNHMHSNALHLKLQVEFFFHLSLRLKKKKKGKNPWPKYGD